MSGTRTSWAGLALVLTIVGCKPGQPVERSDVAAPAPDGAFLSFLTPPVNGAIQTIPHLRVSFGGGMRDAVMDTGSTGIVVSADAIPDVDALKSLGPGRIVYSSSGRVEEGAWVVTPVTIAGGNGRSVTTAPIPVLAVTRISCLRTARNCTPEERPSQVSMIGIGFGREHDRQAEGTPDKNPFLNVAASSPGLSRGYMLSAAGVQVGIAPPSEGGGFSLVKLSRDAAYPDWSGAPACITIAPTPPACGKLLIDTGVGRMFLTVPADRLGGNAENERHELNDGAAVTVALGPDPAAATYDFIAGSRSNPMAPDGVTLSGIGVKPTFVNTSFHVLSGFDYLYDADDGVVGFRRK